jgi:hypothetical protein
MEKSFIYRTLQIASVVTVYSVASVWASTAHIDAISEFFTNINSILVILAIAVAFPYLCFKVLAKLYTPPVSRNLDDLSNSDDLVLSQDEIKAIAIAKKLQTMQYRGNRYKTEDLTTKPATEEKNTKKSQPATKYRGVSIDDNLANSVQQVADSSATEKTPQKSAKPKERMKYRGSYID